MVDPARKRLMVDADVDRGEPSRMVALASLFLDGGYSFGLRQSIDNGVTWDPIGVPSEGYALTVALAPSPPVAST